MKFEMFEKNEQESYGPHLTALIILKYKHTMNVHLTCYPVHSMRDILIFHNDFVFHFNHKSALLFHLHWEPFKKKNEICFVSKTTQLNNHHQFFNSFKKSSVKYFRLFNRRESQVIQNFNSTPTRVSYSLLTMR